MENKLFVGTLPDSITSESLKELFNQYGEVTDAIVILDKITKASKHFGYVTFKTTEMADNAIKHLDGKEIDGKKIFVTHAKPN